MRVQRATTLTSRTKAADDDDDSVPDNDESFETLGRGFNISAARLSVHERNLLQSFRRPDGNDTDEKETQPLSVAQRNATLVKTLAPHCTAMLTEEATCVRSSASGNVLAVGCRHGIVQLLNPHSLETLDTVNLAAYGSDAVCTSIRFRPEAGKSDMQNVMLLAQDNTLLHVHAGTRKLLSKVTEKGNTIAVVEVKPDGKEFATAGADHVVRVYDEATCRLTRTLDHGDNASTFGHSSNVFGLAWSVKDPNLIVSGGWDKTLQVWDLRVSRSVRSMSGPYLCGDAIDIKGDTLITGSWRHARPLQLWDLGKGTLLTNLPWWQPEPEACLPYAACFGRGALARLAFAGGSGKKPMMRVYDLVGPGNIELLGTLQVSRPVHSIDVIGDGRERLVAMACDTQVITLAV